MKTKQQKRLEAAARLERDPPLPCTPRGFLLGDGNVRLETQAELVARRKTEAARLRKLS
jgi:hypothetical protein